MCYRKTPVCEWSCHGGHAEMHLYIPTFLLALGSTLRTAEALYIDPSCVVRSDSEVDLSWPDIHISVWIPPDETITALILTVIFKGHDAAVTSDKITINSRGVVQNIAREMVEENVPHSFLKDFRERGWRDYKFSMKDYAIISLADNRTVFLKVPENHEPSHVKVSGSNVTINCFSEFRVWNVTRTPLTVPLDGRSEEFLSIFSRYKVVPTLTLGRKEVSLYRGRNGSLTVDGPLPLPAFEDHNFTLSFTPASDTLEKCFIKSGGGNVIQVPVAKDLRRRLIVQNNDGNQFFLLQQKSASSLEPLASHQSSADITVVSLTVFLVLAILGIAVLLLYIFRLKKKMKKKKEDVDVEEPLLDRTQESVYKKPSPLLSAVAEDNIMQIEALSCAEDFDRALVEAHLLRRTNLLPVLKTRSKLEENEVITKVLEEYRRREDEIMAAAKKGNYRRGVNILLRLYELPASLRDDEGKTILHHAASAKDDFGAPLWTADNLRSLLTSHLCYFNAVDFHGRTCLHLLAVAANTSPRTITFDGREVTVSKAWLMMAQILVTHSCYPCPDYSGVFPHETAKQNGHHNLATYLEQIHQHSPSPTRTDASLFKELVTAAQENNAVEVRNLILRKSHLLPLDAREDPLTEAVRRGHLEVAMLLLSAGAPLCARPLVSITPLEVAHSKADLPALLPAILRKECVNKLKHEANSIKGGANVAYLQQNIEEFAADINVEGPKARWKFIRDSADKKTRSEKARELLCTAANLGLSFTCQMFGLEDVHLHPLPREENPVSSALKGRKEDTLYILFRDLNMSLSVGSESKLPKEFLAEVLDNEIKNFKKYCRKMKDFAGDNADSLEKELDGALKGSLKGSISKGAMVIISRFGLVSLLKKLKKLVPVNTVIDDLTGFTMLHMSALYGMLDMVEYLLYNGADIETKSKDGLTAERVAAMKGNIECMDYLHIYHKQLSEGSSSVSSGDDFPNMLSNGYQAQVGAFSTLLLPEESGIGVLSEPEEDTRTALLLRKKTEELEISNNDSFRMFIKKWRTKPEHFFLNVIEEEMENLLKEMGGKPNSRFKGKMIRRHLEAIPTGNVPYDSLQVYWQFDCEMYDGFRVKHSNSDKSKCSLDVCLSDGTQSPCIQSFKENFFAEIKETLLTYKFKTPKVWLAYPSVYMMFIGVTIYLLWFDDEGRTRQVRVLIVPVLKADYPEDTNPFPPYVEEGLRQGAPVYITSTGQGRPWTYVMTHLEDMILSQLPEEKKLVFLACQFLEAILNPCWWFPRLQSRRHGRTWKSYAISLSGLADIRQLLSLFLEEVSQTQEEDWKPSTFLNRVLSVYQRATLKNEVRSDIRIFLDPKHDAFTPSRRVLPIAEFLKKMLQNP